MADDERPNFAVRRGTLLRRVRRAPDSFRRLFDLALFGLLVLSFVPTRAEAGGERAAPRLSRANGTVAVLFPEVELALHEPLPPKPAPEASGPGVRTDSFVIYPVLGASELYNDNLFAARHDPHSDFIALVEPSLTVVSDEPARKIAFRAAGHAGRYKMHGSENFTDGETSAEARYDVLPGTRVYGGLWAGQDHEERDSREESLGRGPTRFADFAGYAGILQRIGQLSIRAGGRIERLDFRDTPGSLGKINHDDRDRVLQTGGVRLGYTIAPEVQPFVQAAVDIRRYDDGRDDQGFARDSDGTRLLGGVRATLAPGLTAQIFAGHMGQNYEDARFKDVSHAAFGGVFNWHPRAGTAVDVLVDRWVSETTLANTSSILQTTAGLTVRQEIDERLSAALRLGGGTDKYLGAGQVDTLLSAGATVTWKIGPHFSLVGEYNRLRVTSTNDSDEYGRNTVLLGVEGRF